MGRTTHTQAVEKAIRELLAPKAGDSSMIVCARSARAMGDLFFQAFERASTPVMYLQSQTAMVLNGDFGAAIKSSLARISHAVVIIPDLCPARLPTWLQDVKHSRVLCVSAASPQIFNRWMRIDLRQVIERTQKVADLLSIGRKLQLCSRSGDILTMNLTPKASAPDISVSHRNHAIVFLPAGEVYIRPQMKTLNGLWEVDFLAGQRPTEEPPTKLLLKAGRIQQVKGKTTVAEQLRRFFREEGAEARQILEWGIGTNDGFEYGRSMVEDRKVLGSITLTVGCAHAAEESCQHPLTLVTRGASLTLDGRPLLEKGRLSLT